MQTPMPTILNIMEEMAGHNCPEAICSSHARIDAMKSNQKFHLLTAHPHLQAEAIADHYSKLAAAAMDLRRMVDMRRRAGGSPIIDGCIERLAKQFVDHHREDFGIELSWHNAKLESIPAAPTEAATKSPCMGG